jgi:hypothetical protein
MIHRYWLGIITTILLVLASCFALPFKIFAADISTDPDAELTRLRKEISRVQNDRRHNKDDMDKDAQDAAAYRTRTDTRFSQMQKQIDSISNQTRLLSQKLDSLSALINLTKSERTQIELSNERLSSAVMDACGRIIKLAHTFPPIIEQQFVSSAELLSADITSKVVDNNESMNRLAQILQRMEDATINIQVSQENSPVADIRGTVYRIRLGTVFESVVDIKGEHAAVWTGYNPDGTPVWMKCNQSEAASLLKAAAIREGKSLPDFAMIPFTPDSVSAGKGGSR